MSMQRQVTFWLAALVATGLLLYALGSILLPFVAGMALAYLLDPVADRLERMGLGRLGATILILALFVIGLALVLVILVPLVVHQLAAFADRLPSYVTRLQALLAEEGGPLVKRFGGEEALAQIQRSLGDILGQGAAWAGTFVKSLWTGSQALFGALALLVVTPVVAFYMLIDWDRMVRSVDSWVPPRRRATVRELAREMDRAIAGFVRGQTTVCLILGSFYAVGLTLVGLNFGMLIGMLSGLISFIPYVGSITGLLLSLGVAVVQFWPDWTMILATLAVFFVGQFIEGNILSPKLVGASVGLHPVWVMFALFAFGALFGFVGLLLGVPLAAAVGVLARFALRKYQASALYRSEEIITPLPGEPLEVVPRSGDSLLIRPIDHA